MDDGEVVDLTEPQIPAPESLAVYELPSIQSYKDHLLALQQTYDSLLAHKFELEEGINSFVVAQQAQTVENDDQVLDDKRERLEQTFSRDFARDDNEKPIRQPEELNRELETIDEDMKDQQDAIRKRRLADGEIIEVECSVCFEDHEAATIVVPKSCHHTICSKCTYSYVFKTKEMKLPASCPADTDCPGKIGIDELTDKLSTEDLDTLCRRQLETELIESGQAFYCASARCGEVLKAADEGGEIRVECPSCATRMCSACKVAWHQDFSCEEYKNLPDTERSQGGLSLPNLARQEEWKRCPHCRTMISLTLGCNHMTCR